MTKTKKTVFSTIAALALIVVLAVCFSMKAAAKVSGEELTFSIRGQEYRGEFIDETNRHGNRHVEVISYLPIDTSNYAMIVDLDAPVGDNIKIIDDVETLDKFFGFLPSENRFEVADNEFCFHTRYEICPPDEYSPAGYIHQCEGVRDGKSVSTSVYWDYDYDNDIMTVTIKADCYADAE